MEKNGNNFFIENDKDWFLQILVNIVNENSNGLSFGISLITNGFIISGDLISGKEYFETFGELFQSVFPSELKITSISEEFKSMGEKVYDKPIENDQKKSTEYIHLKNAKYIQTVGMPIPAKKDGVLWRGRISEIAGFNLGSMEILKEE